MTYLKVPNNVRTCLPPIIRAFILAKAFLNFDWSTSTGIEAFSPLIYLRALKFVIPSIFAVIETTSVWRVSLKNVFPKTRYWLFNELFRTFFTGAGEVVTSSQRYGYGNCQRLVGKSFTNILQRFQGDYILTRMDLHVVPPAGFTEDEVFKVSWKNYAKPEDKVWLTS